MKTKKDPPILINFRSIYKHILPCNQTGAQTIDISNQIFPSAEAAAASLRSKPPAPFVQQLRSPSSTSATTSTTKQATTIAKQQQQPEDQSPIYSHNVAITSSPALRPPPPRQGNSNNYNNNANNTSSKSSNRETSAEKKARKKRILDKLKTEKDRIAPGNKNKNYFVPRPKNPPPNRKFR